MGLRAMRMTSYTVTPLHRMGVTMRDRSTLRIARMALRVPNAVALLHGMRVTMREQRNRHMVRPVM